MGGDMTTTDDLLDMAKDFFSNFGNLFFKNYRANGGILLTSIVVAAMEAAEEAFENYVKAGVLKRDFATANAIATAKLQGIKLEDNTITNTIHTLIEMNMPNLKADKSEGA